MAVSAGWESACPAIRGLSLLHDGPAVLMPALDGCPDDGGGEESEAKRDAHRAFAAELVKRDFARAREPSGDQPIEPQAGLCSA
jgi:hypothetical protein